jgi:hypothetical protein
VSPAQLFALSFVLVLLSSQRPMAVAQQAASAGPSPNATVAGELVLEPATLINLGFEWFIQGDANRNAAVDVSFRKAGDTSWHAALPLLRLQGERVYAESRGGRHRAQHVCRERAGSRTQVLRTTYTWS